MGVIISNKELSAHRIECGGTFNVTLSLSASQDIASSPADIVLILDRSSAMAGSALANLKRGAKRLIDIINKASDGSSDGRIGCGSRMGIVSFAGSASRDMALSTSTASLKAAVDALSAGGKANHADAFASALKLFSPSSPNKRVMIMLSSGIRTAGGNPSAVAAAAKAMGVTIFSIGLCAGGIREDALRDWASHPGAAHTIITPNGAEVADMLDVFADNAALDSPSGIVITERVAPCFRITCLSTPTCGEATRTGTGSLQWEIDSLGRNDIQGALLEFTVEHVGGSSGTVEVNDELTYVDNEGGEVCFPSPEIYVDCGIVVPGEDCPTPMDVTVGGCSDCVEMEGCELDMESGGCIVHLDATIRSVCPNRRVALGVVLTELDEEGEEHNRGLKTMAVPAHTEESCRDVVVRCIRFVLPESLSLAAGGSPCGQRRLRARLIAHYIDSDYSCCEYDD